MHRLFSIDISFTSPEVSHLFWIGFSNGRILELLTICIGFYWKTGICWWLWYGGMVLAADARRMLECCQCSFRRWRHWYQLLTLYVYTIHIRLGCYFSQSIDLTTCGLRCCAHHFEPNRTDSLKSNISIDSYSKLSAVTCPFSLCCCVSYFGSSPSLTIPKIG